MMKRNVLYVTVVAIAAIACTSPKEKETADTSAEQPPSVRVVGQETTYSSDTVQMVGYLTQNVNDSSKKPGILVVHEWWGHNQHSRERAEMLAELGYVALAVDMYGEGKQAAHPQEAGEFAGMVMGNFDAAKARFESAMSVLKNHPNVDPDKIGAIGYCFGGSVVLSMANAGYDLDAVASFHGGLGLPVMPDSGAVKAQILVANGADDKFIPEQQIEDYKMVMDAAGAEYTFINYEGALHSFTNKSADSIAQVHGMDVAYNAAADSASWEQMKQLFAQAF